MFAMSTFEREFCAKYPFTETARKYIASTGFSLEDLASGEFIEIVERAKARIREAIQKGEVSTFLEGDLDVEILSYPVALVILGLLGEARLARRYAVAESKRVEELLLGEDDDMIVRVAKEAFSWRLVKERARMGSRLIDFRMPVHQFVATAATFHDPHWKLVNKLVYDGQVHLRKTEVARLIAEEVKNRVLARISELTSVGEEALKSLQPHLEELRREASGRMKYLELPEEREASEDAYPPCIRKLLEDLRAGKSLPHMGRFALTTFLVNVGVDVDEVVALFSSAADFDEGKTRYQVEHIAGLRGSKIKYLPPSCETLKSFGLCVEEAGCGNIKHPLIYYRRKLKKRRATSGGTEPSKETV